MKPAFISALFGILILVGCSSQRKVCPAYQSAFVFDPTVEKKNFMLYNASKDLPHEVLASNKQKITLPVRDSTWDKSIVIQAPALPIQHRVKKNRYLLLPRKSYRQAMNALQTIPKKPVYPKKEMVDSIDIRKALDSAARSITDTLTVRNVAKKKEKNEEDSVYVISIAKEKFNVEQDNYMWYFRDILVLPDVRIAMNQNKDKEVNADGTQRGKKEGFFDKLKNLFKKKPKEKEIGSEKQDSVRTPQFEDLRDLPDSTGTVQSSQPKEQQQVIKKKKGFNLKGLGRLFKKKEKKKQIETESESEILPPKTRKKDEKEDEKKVDEKF